MNINMYDLSYELGVMMCNASYGISDSRYDVTDNFLAIIRHFESKVQVDRVLEGFIEEASNRGISADSADKEFKIFIFDEDLFQD